MPRRKGSGEWIRCGFCGNNIFKLTRYDASVEYFDRRGKPWPLHRCLGLESQLAYRRNVDWVAKTRTRKDRGGGLLPSTMRHTEQMVIRREERMKR